MIIIWLISGCIACRIYKKDTKKSYWDNIYALILSWGCISLFTIIWAKFYKKIIR